MPIRSAVKCALTTALTVIIVSATREAGANGRFPRGQQFYEFPSDHDHLLLAATYGLVTSKDGGKNWHYICETAFSFFPPADGFPGDPLVGIMDDESLLLGAQSRVTKSIDAACDWTKSFEEAGAVVDDIAVAPSDRKTAVALVRFPTQMPIVSRVYRTVDRGASWTAIGSPITTLVVGYTIDVDPKDPAHFMVTGITTYDPTVESGIFLSSTNDGMTWASSPIPKTNVEAGPYIAAVHPTDPNKIFVRTDEWLENDVGGYDARDALLYSKDGGKTWTELLRLIGPDGPGGKLFGFALSPDGATVLAGYGDPIDGSGRTVDRTLTGVYKSSGPDYSFGTTPTPLFSDLVSCLSWTPNGIYVCASPDGGIPYISRANDISSLNAAGLTKVMEMDKMKGEPPCCAGRSVTTCDWPSVACIRFKVCDDASIVPPPGPDAAVCMPEGGAGGRAGDAGDDRSTGGASGGGMGGAGMGGRAGAGTGGATGGTGGGDDGCKCRMSATSHGPSPPALGVLLALAGVSGWRRWRPRQARAALHALARRHPETADGGVPTA